MGYGKFCKAVSGKGGQAKSMTYAHFVPFLKEIQHLQEKGGQKGTKCDFNKINNLQNRLSPFVPLCPPRGASSTEKGDKRGHTPLGVSPCPPRLLAIISPVFVVTELRKTP